MQNESTTDTRCPSQSRPLTWRSGFGSEPPPPRRVPAGAVMRNESTTHTRWPLAVATPHLAFGVRIGTPAAKAGAGGGSDCVGA